MQLVAAASDIFDQFFKLRTVSFARSSGIFNNKNNNQSLA